MTKLCTKCGGSGPFYKDGKGGLTSACRECIKGRSKKAYQDNPEPAKKRAKASHMRRVMARYGITEEGYNALLRTQGGVCATCKRGCKTHRRLSVDHDHETGEVRGLLCMNCNAALGLVGDDVTVLRSLIEYLENR